MVDIVFSSSGFFVRIEIENEHFNLLIFDHSIYPLVFSLIIIIRDALFRFRDTKNGKEEKKSKKKPGVKNTSTDNLGNIFEIFGDDNPRQKTQPEDKKFKPRPRSGKEGQNSGTTKSGNL